MSSKRIAFVFMVFVALLIIGGATRLQQNNVYAQSGYTVSRISVAADGTQGNTYSAGPLALSMTGIPYTVHNFLRKN